MPILAMRYPIYSTINGNNQTRLVRPSLPVQGSRTSIVRMFNSFSPYRIDVINLPSRIEADQWCFSLSTRYATLQRPRPREEQEQEEQVPYYFLHAY